MPETFSRRDFLKLSGLAAAASALSACHPILPFPVPTRSLIEPLDNRLMITRGLRRITFGPHVDEYLHAIQVSLDPFIEEQLSPDTIPDPEVESHLAGFKTLSQTAQQVIANSATRDTPAQELAAATLIRAVYSKRQLYELMVDFWSNHFNIYIRKTQEWFLKTVDDQEVIRPHALGKFADLLSASAHSPAMLVYLDNALSSKSRPNENYGRELMELHTLGVDGGYTQADVKDVSRTLTGWDLWGAKGHPPYGFLYKSKGHDAGEKLILGKHYPAGRGIEEGEQVLDFLAHHPSTAQFISTKLVRRFVSDDPPASLVAQAAAAFQGTDGDIARVMGTILHSQEFKASLGQKIKRPFEFIASALRSTNASTQAGSPTLDTLQQMGQPLFRWDSPDGFPDNGTTWTTTTGMLSRWNYALELSYNLLQDTRLDVAALSGPVQSPAGAVDVLSQLLLGEKMPNPGRQVLLEFAAGVNLEQALPALTALILASPYFQYR